MRAMHRRLMHEDETDFEDLVEEEIEGEIGA